MKIKTFTSVQEIIIAFQKVYPKSLVVAGRNSENELVVEITHSDTKKEVIPIRDSVTSGYYMVRWME